nr:M23 family metallopeptidase [Sporolactobacillus nakayamae]
MPLESYYCFGKPVYAPFSGEVVTVENSVLDGEKASWLHDQPLAIHNSLFFDSERDGFESIGGNYVLLKKKEGIYAVFCHLQKNSIVIKAGEKVQKGQLIGKVGHSGNSTEPHLHFHLMDSADIEKANGIPFVFEQYEKYNGSNWEKITNKIPAAKDRIRFLK